MLKALPSSGAVGTHQCTHSSLSTFTVRFGEQYTNKKYSTAFTSILIFFLSGLLHDYIIALSFRVFSSGFMVGMLVQAMAIKLGTMVGKYLHIENSTYCNWFTWIDIIAAMTSWSSTRS